MINPFKEKYKFYYPHEDRQFKYDAGVESNFFTSVNSWEFYCRENCKYLYIHPENFRGMYSQTAWTTGFKRGLIRKV